MTGGGQHAPGSTGLRGTAPKEDGDAIGEARQYVGIAVRGPLAEAHVVEGLSDAAPGGLIVHSEMHAERLRQLATDTQHGVESGGRLEGERDPPPADVPPPLLVEGAQVYVAETQAT